ncbi:MAG: HDOD domain-containing protein [Verrucomicrobiota bacterium]|nr:HDOD domain-containing protein [Verrucomicrobiota bacterium]
MRILYVDEQEHGFNYLLRYLRNSLTWEIAYASTRERALELASHELFTVLLISKSFPDCDAVELANGIRGIHPRIVVFILCALEEDERSLAYAGRFQTLPQNILPATLVTTIRRAMALQGWLTNNTTLDLVKGVESLPSIPYNYLGVLKHIHSPHASIKDIGDAIAVDIGMTSKLLQVANSAFYGYAKTITHPTHAVSLLGLETVKSLIHYTHIMNHFPRLGGAQAWFEKIWSHSMAVASAAKKIAMNETNNEQIAEDAFTAGLLHDIGKLVLLSVKPQEFKDVLNSALEKNSSPWLLERVRLGTTHAETGAYLLALWGIPVPILEAVAWHHYPEESGDETFTPLTAVHAANALDYINPNGEINPAHPQFDYDYLKRLGLGGRVPVWRDLVNAGKDTTHFRKIQIKDLMEEEKKGRPSVVQKKKPPTAWIVGGAILLVILILIFAKLS